MHLECTYATINFIEFHDATENKSINILTNYQVDRPAPFFQKRNATRLVVRNRNSVTRTTTTTTAAPSTTIKPTQVPKAIRKVMRRKITRNPIFTTKVPTTLKVETTTIPESTTQNYEQFSEGIDDEIAGVLPALTSAKPRKTFKPVSVVEATTRALQVQPNQLLVEEKVERKQTSFDKLLQQQYKIKGLDISDEESYEEDERLIGVLGSQVCDLLIKA